MSAAAPLDKEEHQESSTKFSETLGRHSKARLPLQFLHQKPDKEIPERLLAFLSYKPPQEQVSVSAA